MSQAAAAFESHRRHLIGLAYRMLGSIADAEDIVQEAWLRWQAEDRSEVREPRAFLSTMVTRMCLDELKSARVQREEYVGPWLPDPIVDETALSPEAATEIAADLSIALLLALERLSPLERAAFLLHDVFDVDFSEIAETLGRNEAACRQLATRARANVAAARPRFKPDANEHARLLAAFASAATKGDMQGLTQLLAKDAVLLADGGGKVAAAQKPIVGADRVAKFVTGLVRKGVIPADLQLQLVRVNGLPGLVLSSRGYVFQTVSLEIVDGRIATIYTMRNPDKLKHLRH